MKDKANRLYKCVFGIICILLGCMYISLIFNINVWTDEAYTIELVRNHSFRGIISETALDVHPPLYYLLLKVFVSLFGDSIRVFKLFSILPMFGLMLLTWLKVRKYWGETVAILMLLFLNGIPCMLEYVVQIRMYSLACFWVTWAGLSAYGVWKKRTVSEFVQLTIVALLACYTHTYAMISCVFLYAILILFEIIHALKQKDGKGLFKVFFSGILVAVGFAPWLRVLVKQTLNRVGNYWIESITVKEILSYPSFLFQTAIPYATEMLIGLCILGILVAIRKQKEALLFLGIPMLTALFGIAISVLVTPFFIPRYLVPCVGLLALFLAIAFGTQKQYLRIFIGIFMICMIASTYKVNYEQEYNKTHTQELMDFLEENMTEQDIIVYNYELYGFIYKIYFDVDRTIFLGDMDFSRDFRNVWYFDSCVSPWLDSQVLLEHGLKKEHVGNLGIEQNEFILYKISHE